MKYSTKKTPGSWSVSRARRRCIHVESIAQRGLRKKSMKGRTEITKWQRCGLSQRD